MRLITMNAEIDMSDINTSDLIDELKRRKTEFKDEFMHFDSDRKLLNHFRKCLGLYPHHTTEDIIKAIHELSD